MLIDQMSGGEWDPAQHPNEYRKALTRLLSSKRRFAIAEAPKGRAEESNVVDLMDALKKSLGSGAGGPGRARPKRAAARRRGAA